MLCVYMYVCVIMQFTSKKRTKEERKRMMKEERRGAARDRFIGEMASE